MVRAVTGDRAALLDEIGQGALAQSVELAGGTQHRAGHLGMAAQVPWLQPRELAIMGAGDTRADHGGRLTGLDGTQLVSGTGWTSTWSYVRSGILPVGCSGLTRI